MNDPALSPVERVWAVPTATPGLARFGEVTLLRNWAVGLAATVLLHAAYVAVRYAGQPLLEHEAWRQTMTAITSYWMLEEGWKLAYQTPVLGYPWSVPIEVPIYQSLVALIVWISGLPLDAVGRLVSFAFLLACGWPAVQIARRLDLPASAAWVFCALLWSSPLYLFYGRNFLMEVPALFFTFAAIPYALDLRAERPRWSSVAFFALFATLGTLQKATTTVPMVVVMAGLLAWSHLATAGWRLPAPNRVVRIGIAFGIPTLAALAWLIYSTGLRASNEVYATMYPPTLVENWLAGRGLRTNPAALKLIFWNRLIGPNAAGFLGASLLLGGLAYARREIRHVLIVTLILFALPIYVTIHSQHFLDYYQVGAALFLPAALAITLVVVMPHVIRARFAIPALTLILVFSNLYHYYTGYGRYTRRVLTTETSSTLAVADVLRRYVPETAGIAVYGLVSYGGLEPVVGWSSEIAYYSGRKALTLADNTRHLEHVWTDPARFLGEKDLGALVFCFSGNGLGAIYERILAKHAGPAAELFQVGDCRIWLPDTQSIVLADGRLVEPTPPTDWH